MKEIKNSLFEVIMIEIAKISQQGQVTIPMEIRKKLDLRPGDKLAFLSDENGCYLIANASLLALKVAQDEFQGAAEGGGVKDEGDLLRLIKESR